jgi:hypothetical protein
MVEHLKQEYGLSYGAKLIRVLVKQAYDRSKGPYSLEKWEESWAGISIY